MSDPYLTVTALTAYIKRKLSGDPHLKEVWLRGEISNFKHHSRGHMYMSLKDANARIQAVMFAGNNAGLKFVPENGMNVLIKGEVNVYEPMGQYQLYIKDMQPDGIGALYLAFEQLKDKLEKEGLFSPELKKPLPVHPKHIGVVTSPTGAAIRDILTTLERRYPLVSVSILPVLVQGERAAISVSKAIAYANEHMDCDVLIVGRGGGSIEDLWGFNEEILARAIYQSSIPIISAVGHETDTTISDFVADVRAATPTGAAELAVPSMLELREQLKSLQHRLDRVFASQVSEARQSLNRLKKSYAFKYPDQLMKQKEQDLDRLLDRLTKQMKVRTSTEQASLVHLQTRLQQQRPEKRIKEEYSHLLAQHKQLTNHFEQVIMRKKESFLSTLDKLSLLNPLDVMKRGYAIPYNQKGKVIKHTGDTHTGDKISIQVTDGSLLCRVDEIKEGEKDGQTKGYEL